MGGERRWGGLQSCARETAFAGPVLGTMHMLSRLKECSVMRCPPVHGQRTEGCRHVAAAPPSLYGRRECLSPSCQLPSACRTTAAQPAWRGARAAGAAQRSGRAQMRRASTERRSGSTCRRYAARPTKQMKMLVLCGTCGRSSRKRYGQHSRRGPPMRGMLRRCGEQSVGGGGSEWQPRLGDNREAAGDVHNCSENQAAAFSAVCPAPPHPRVVLCGGALQEAGGGVPPRDSLLQLLCGSCGPGDAGAGQRRELRDAGAGGYRWMVWRFSSAASEGWACCGLVARVLGCLVL